jgi:hypothetical protein
VVPSSVLAGLGAIFSQITDPRVFRRFRFFAFQANGFIGASRKGAFSRDFSPKGEVFHNIDRGVFRDFLKIEKRPSRRGPVFSGKTRFFRPTFCRWASFPF